MNILMQTLKSLLLKFIKDIDEGNCNIEGEELQKIVSSLQDYTRRDLPISKYQAYTYLNISRATFDTYVREGKIPRGQKVQGFKELQWFKKDLDKAIKDFKESSLSRRVGKLRFGNDDR